jgi:hypothetical protein
MSAQVETPGALAARARRLVETAQEVRLDLPPSACLLVRRLRDPLPRRLLSSHQTIVPSAEWEVAVRRALERCAREAARPATGPVPANANAVLFYDQGELLACLARDLVGGEATLRWWWLALRRSLPSGALDALVAAWCRDAAAVPAALDVLARTSALQPVLAALTASQALTVLRAVAATFEMPHVLSFLALDNRVERETGGALQTAEMPASATLEPAPRKPLPDPWRPLIPDSLMRSSLGPERQLLLGIGLLLARAPAIVRSRDFVEQVATWWRAPATRAARQEGQPPQTLADGLVAEAPTARAQPRRPDVIAAPSTADEARGVTRPDERPPEPPLSPTIDSKEIATGVAESLSLPRDDHPTTERTASREPPSKRPHRGPDAAVRHPLAPRRLKPAHGAPREEQATRRRAVRAQREEQAGRVVDASGTRPVTSEPADQPPRVEPAWAVTDIGGTFFLVTLLSRLDFFVKLERDFGVTTDIGGWTWIELLARALLGARLDNHLADPVWRCLAALDRREPGTEIGGSFRGADVYVLPAAWAVQLPPAEIATARRDLGPIGLALSPELRRFLEFLLPFFRWRLTRALALEDDSAIAGTLLESPARVFASATHVDVRFPLDAARPAVRLAGLDANPGWVPALGRVVSFEFL